MKKLAPLFVLLAVSGILFASPEITLKPGLSITRSVVISRQLYTLNADTALTKPLIVITGKNITVDFNNAVLQGSNNKALPNGFYGLAVMVMPGSSNITILNANIHGYKIAIMADSVEQLHIYNSNCSYNYRQRLHSNWQREDVSDWQSYHHNENGEWKRYGAGIYLYNCNGAALKGNTVTGGQCGLMMTRCNYADVYNNDFSFNSGLGIGMYRSSNNRVYNNRLDFNVRGYSDGIYYRGQDSGGILVFEQCSNNVFAYNSVTHGGDGFFLWAGQYTMDSGKGGCNDNLLYGNDFSYAPTNGVELTFSRNDIEKNIINECDNAIWGGYSYSTVVYDNEIKGNHTGIAIEHGQNNAVGFNRFEKNTTSIKLWGHTIEPSDWGYPKYRDTKSHNYQVYGNSFVNEKLVYDIMETDSLWFESNIMHGCGEIYKLGKLITRLDTSRQKALLDIPAGSLSKNNLISGINRVPATFDKYKHPGRGQIRVTEWGPYDFRYPLVFLQKVDKDGLYHFEVMHPGGTWQTGQLKGFSIVQQHGDSIVAKADSAVTDRFLQLQYTGKAFTDMFGKQHAANNTYLFSYHEFDAHPQWNINFYKWDSAHAADKDYSSFTQSLQTPVYTTTANKIDYTWWGAVGKGLPADSFATVATTVMDLPEHDYTLSLTADDMVKLYIDDKPVIDAWDPSIVNLDENTNHNVKVHLKGKHTFKIVHAEIGGLATLMFYLNESIMPGSARM
ncbi:MAG TPA: right-handed parallel beta-helix repeat-containing protein [Chitinophagaceae bacterium]|nr:right-handed parallel beta-helix repeat-containing protein [Chitinophagaceae bacterium]